MNTKTLICLFWIGFLIPVHAGASAPSTLYRNGQYDQAIEAGVAANTSEGLTFAARAMLAKEMMRIEPCLDCLRKATALLQQAIADDPSNADAHVFLAVALGYQARLVGIITAKVKGYPETAKDHLDIALKLDPDNAWALAALGGWNIEIVAHGGQALARLLYGASLQKGLREFEESFAAAPANIVLHYQYALALSGYDHGQYRKKIVAALQFAATGTPKTAYEIFVQKRARELLRAFQRNDFDAYDRLLKRAKGYP